MPRSTKEEALATKDDAFGYYSRGMDYPEIARRVHRSERHVRRLVASKLREMRAQREEVIGDSEFYVVMAQYGSLLRECWREINNPPRDDEGNVRRDAPKSAYIALATNIVNRLAKLQGLDKPDAQITINNNNFSIDDMVKALSEQNARKITKTEVKKIPDFSLGANNVIDVE